MAPQSKKTSAKKSAESEMDAVALLKADHRAVEDMFASYEKARAPKKQELAKKICLELTVHSLIEEEIFYPAVKGDVEEDLLDEAYVEHDGAKVLIAELLAGSPDDDFYDAKVKVLSEMIKHHVKEEEKRAEGMFAQARDAGVDMEDLGRRMSARKKELKAEFKASGIPDPVTRTMHDAKIVTGEPFAEAAE
ncbi:MAG: hypothetical protein RJB62_1710 [Pseudomonadota bacterium]